MQILFVFIETFIIKINSIPYNYFDFNFNNNNNKNMNIYRKNLIMNNNFIMHRACAGQITFYLRY